MFQRDEEAEGVLTLTYPGTGSSQSYYPTGSADPQLNNSAYKYDGNGNVTTSTNTGANIGVSQDTSPHDAGSSALLMTRGCVSLEWLL